MSLEGRNFNYKSFGAPYNMAISLYKTRLQRIMVVDCQDDEFNYRDFLQACLMKGIDLFYTWRLDLNNITSHS